MSTKAADVDALLRHASLVFWDFDGVIKDSVSVKSDAFEQLFLQYGPDVARRVRRHHEAHGGVSRFEKIPLYLTWAGQDAAGDMVRSFCEDFSRLVAQAVIDSAWVPGVREYLQANCPHQRFVLVTATPQDEIELILRSTGIAGCFHEVHGAPVPKAAAMADVLRRLRCAPADALAVGDSDTDLDAAAANGVPFLLRRTALNGNLQQRHIDPAFETLGVSPL